MKNLSRVCMVAAIVAIAARTSAEVYNFTTLAGNAIYGTTDGVGSAARFRNPIGLAIDHSGNLYVGDNRNFTIRKIAPDGTVTTLAGLPLYPGSVDGTGSTARFYNPAGVTVDTAGNIYVADSNNNAIRKITPTGVVTTWAGVLGVAGAGSADGIGNDARFSGPSGVAADRAGDVFVADAANNTIRKISPDQNVTTLAGSPGIYGSADGTGAGASFNLPYGVAVGGDGSVYVADTENDTIRKIDTSGKVTTLAGLVGVVGVTDGHGSAARFWNPFGLTVDQLGNIYVADAGDCLVRKITPAGDVTTLAGSGAGDADGVGTGASFFSPEGIVVDGAGNLFVADSGNNAIREISAANRVTTFAGRDNTFGAADGPAQDARFDAPYGVTADKAGNVYVADANACAIRKISPDGQVTTLAGQLGAYGSQDGSGSNARFGAPFGICIDPSGNLFVTDYSKNTIRMITPIGVVTTFAGVAGVAGHNDGAGSAAHFSGPEGVTVDRSGNLFVADTGNDTIRMITPAGVVTTIAGAAGSAGYVDGPAKSARFLSPHGLALDAGGNLYVADSNNEVIRMISPAGEVTTFAGAVQSFGMVDGVGGAARFGNPSGLSIDGNGNLYVADSANNLIRKITPAAVVTTLGGNGNFYGGNADGLGSDAQFLAPEGIFSDAFGNLLIADTDNNEIRRGTVADASAPSIVVAPESAVVVVGGNAIFSVTAAGEPTPAYQWERRAAGSDDFVPLQDGGAYGGSNTPTLTISPADATMDGDEFCCVITNGIGAAVTSAPATLTVDPLIVITTPDHADFALGRSNSYAVVATGRPAPSFEIIEGTVPAWLQLDAATGVLSGTPPPEAVGATYDFTIEARNDVAPAVQQDFALRVISAPAVTSLPAPRQVVNQWQNLTLAVAVTGAPTLQWKHNGRSIAGATSASYTITSATPRDAGYYQAVLTNAVGTVTSDPVFVVVACDPADVVVWGSPAMGQDTVPDGLGPICAVAIGAESSLALKADGTITGWGGAELAPPAGLDSVVAIAAAEHLAVALKADGTVVAWGADANGETNVPAGLTGVVAVAAAGTSALALKADGTVAAWGRAGDGLQSIPAGLTNVIAIAARGAHALALKADGTVVAWGNDSDDIQDVPAGLSDVTAIATGSYSSLALKSDGTLVAWGSSLHDITSIPPGLTGVVSMAVSDDNGIVVNADGAMTVWGATDGLAAMPTGLNRTVAVAADSDVAIALGDPVAYTIPSITTQPVSQTVGIGQVARLTVEAAGPALGYQWKRDDAVLIDGADVVGSQTSTLTVLQAEASDAGHYAVVVSNPAGIVISRTVSLLPVTPPTITTAPSGQTVTYGQSATFGVTATDSRSLAFQWLLNGLPITGATADNLSVTPARPEDIGIYSVQVTDGLATVTSPGAILGTVNSQKVVGDGVEVASDIHHPNGNIYDQVLLTGPAAAVTADPGQVTRISFIDLNDDIVQVEFAGAGTLALILDQASGPAAPILYNQSVNYMKGRAGIVITGADETTNVSVYSVGRLNAVNQALFRDDVTYDGVADIAFIAIASADGNFGGVRAANANCSASEGLTGIYAPNVRFTGPIYIGNIDAFDAAIPVLVTGGTDEVLVAGGDLRQPNNLAVETDGVGRFVFVNGVTSQSVPLVARNNAARIVQDGIDVTADVVVNP